MLLAVASLLFLPWLDRSPVRSVRYKGAPARLALAAFVLSFIGLGYLGLQPAAGTYVVLARCLAAVYFAFFWLMPLYSKMGAAKAPPERVH
jgi:ubiquinol-cytochrome c reductase cytochrome b subunit